MAEKQRVMIVDDDPSIAELISLYLMKECYDTLTVEDGEEALRQFPVYKPDIVLLDLMLPGIDGYQVCRQLRMDSDVPVRSLTRCLDWNWARMTILSSRSTPRSLSPGSKLCCAGIPRVRTGRRAGRRQMRNMWSIPD